MRLYGLISLCALMAMTACGGGNNGVGSNNQGSGSPGITAISVTCDAMSLRSTQTSQCSARVSGTGSYSSTVTWSVDNGTISSSGLFTAGAVSAPSTANIIATSAQDASKSGIAHISLTSNIDSVNVSCPPTIQSGAQGQCTATVTGVGTVSQDVEWSAKTDFADCGCISSAGVITAPSVPTNETIHVIVTSAADASKGNRSDVNVLPSGTVTGVSVSCTKTELIPGQDTLCTATVSGTGSYSSATNWGFQAVPGSIPSVQQNPAVFVAGKVDAPEQGVVVATSVQNPMVSGSAAVTVSPSGQRNNAIPLAVDGGPTGLQRADFNMPFTSVTVCSPGTDNCQTIDHVLVDTGSTGLRLLAAGPAGGVLTLPLTPTLDAGNGNPVYECATFVSGYLWGPVAKADVLTLADGSGEQASYVGIQIVGLPGEATTPGACQNSGVDASNLQALGANGILGVSSDQSDCPGMCYFTCGNSACVSSLGEYVTQPVFSFAQDNQGVVIQLPPVAPPGTSTLTGSMLFGINSQGNNNLGKAIALQPDISSTYMGVNYSGTIFDTGSGGYYFLTSRILGGQMPTCNSMSGFYCPANTQIFTATNNGSNNVSSAVTFSVDNANTLFQNASFAVFPTLAGEWPLSPPLFDFGLPFFYGRSVFIALPVPIPNTTLVGPFVAY